VNSGGKAQEAGGEGSESALPHTDTQDIEIQIPEPDLDAFNSFDFEALPVDDLEKTPVHGVSLAGFRLESTVANVSGAPERDELTTMANFEIPEREPDLAVLQEGLIGLDLGSSDAVIAAFNEHGKAVVVTNSDNERSTPVRLLYDEGEWLIGREAQSLAPFHPDQDLSDFKSLFQMEGWSTNVAGEEVGAEQLMQVFISRLLEEAQEQLACVPTSVALAAPVWFKEPQREALARAVGSCGLEVVGVTDELLAACVPYSLRLPDLAPRRVVVVDVGQRGSSVAIVRCATGDLDVRYQAGLPDLGGRSWDDLLLAEGVAAFNAEHGFDPRADATCLTDLSLRVEQAKKALSQRRQYEMPIQSEGRTAKVKFSRERLEELSAPLLRKLEHFLERFRERAGDDDWGSFDALVVSGGGARIPMVRKAIEAVVGRDSESFTAEENVAIGALYWGVSARHAAARADAESE
jgi:molecular chaperone DnaK